MIHDISGAGGWYGCQMRQPIGIVAGRLYWIAVNHPDGSLVTRLQHGGTCGVRSVAGRSVPGRGIVPFESLPTPFPKEDSLCEDLSGLGMFIGDGSPTVVSDAAPQDDNSGPDIEPPSAPSTDSDRVCFRIDINSGVQHPEYVNVRDVPCEEAPRETERSRNDFGDEIRPSG